MINLSDKNNLTRILEHFDVNRVAAFPAREFLSEASTDIPLWGIRSIDKRGGGGLFVHGMPAETVKMVLNRKTVRVDSVGRIVLDGGKEHRINLDSLIVCESMLTNDRDNLICNGEVMLYRDDFGEYSWTGWINKEKGLNLRQAQGSASVVNVTSRFQVPTVVEDLIWEKMLLGTVVEFSLYDKPVGIKNNPLLIWEIRKY